jgi:tetratricopeptide (TPR) repeat protein
MMKKLIFILTLLCSSLTLKAQDVSGVNQYSDGFSKGYKKGYCFGMEPGTCIAPVPPIPPVPSGLESPDSYQDGYNEGFSQGLAEQKNISNKNQGYQTSSPESIDFIYKLNAGSILEIAAAQRRLKGIAFGYYNNKDYYTCLALCLKLLPTDPYDSELYLLLGASYAGEGDYKRALDYMLKAKQYDPNNNMYDRAILDYQEKYNKSKN